MNRVSDDIRYDRMDYLLVSVPEKKDVQGKAAAPLCVQCVKNVVLACALIAIQFFIQNKKVIMIWYYFVLK